MSITTNKMLPIGVSDFRKLVEHRNTDGVGYVFVDKTLLIKEILLDGSEVIVLPRPRRFGKTLNLSMLRYFFAPTVQNKSTKGLFDNLKIAEYKNGMAHQGKYPVIFLSFKEAKYSNFTEMQDGLRAIIAELFLSFKYLISSQESKLEEEEVEIFQSILKKSSSEPDLSQSLRLLSKFLCKHFGVKPYLLIDEYDIPIQEAYLKGYYIDAVDFIRNLFSAALKDNEHISKAVLTGIVRVSKESLFSGLNNIAIYSILNSDYSQYFGFTEQEVDELLHDFSVEVDRAQITNWYNGYKFGDNTIYNPWSILNCMKNKGALQAYWVNTSSNLLAKQQIEHGTANVKNKLRLLMQGEVIKEPITEHFVFEDLDKGQIAIWSLLALTGYLKVVSQKPAGQRHICDLAIPNKEVEDFYTITVEEWLSAGLTLDWFHELLENLTSGKVLEFEEKLNRFVLESASYLDISSDKQENFYHALMLGLVAGLKDNYIIKSNRESGLARYDLAIIPQNRDKLGIIMEFKKLADKDGVTEGITDTAKQALEQAEQTEYTTELKQVGIKNILIMGMVFSGKKVTIQSKMLP